jgi:ATP-dependent DNA helicase RecQ
MRNQVRLAQRMGVKAETINSGNQSDWAGIDRRLGNDGCDVLLISPERLGSDRFLHSTMPALTRGIGLFVVDEAHCISDWGHDFRPDYRRIVRILQRLPANIPVLATTATANDRVIHDITAQLGPELATVRGSLARRSLRLQTVQLDDQAVRLAWLAAAVPRMPGSGIVYCLTQADTERVSRWLELNGNRAPAYHGGLDDQTRQRLEDDLLRNRVKALVATVALGMGFDKPDLGFVIHYQRPGSVIAYYQQIGRAGRAVDTAIAVLLNGREDDDIQDYFIRTAFPSVEEQNAVVRAIEASDGLTVAALERSLNLSRGRILLCLKHLEIDGVVAHVDSRYERTARRWVPDAEHIYRVTEQRMAELRRMQQFVLGERCLMEFVQLELNDPDARPCGRCAVCAGLLLPNDPPRDLIVRATAFLRGSYHPIRQKTTWPRGLSTHLGSGPIPTADQVETGIALSEFGDGIWGDLVSLGKYQHHRFDQKLVVAAAHLIRLRWEGSAGPEWITAVPSRRDRSSSLVPDFAARLAKELGLPFSMALTKERDAAQQKRMRNSTQQVLNVASTLRVNPQAIRPGRVLLVDDIVDSGWTLTVCGVLLRRAGSGLVLPFALAKTRPSQGDM